MFILDMLDNEFGGTERLITNFADVFVAIEHFNCRLVFELLHRLHHFNFLRLVQAVLILGFYK